MAGPNSADWSTTGSGQLDDSCLELDEISPQGTARLENRIHSGSTGNVLELYSAACLMSAIYSTILSIFACRH